MRRLGVMGAVPRYAPVLDAHFVCGGEDVLRTLDQMCTRIGYTKRVHVDPGPKGISPDRSL
jgi:putative transposase